MEEKFKYQIWSRGEPIILCDTLEEAERRKTEKDDYIEWILISDKKEV